MLHDYRQSVVHPEHGESLATILEEVRGRKWNAGIDRRQFQDMIKALGIDTSLFRGAEK